MIPRSFSDFYGDQTRWFIGQVVDNKNDPLKLGRVKVKVFGVYDDIADEDLPWAQIIVPVTQGIHEGKGQNLGILVGTQVFGVFMDGQSSQLPLVIGTIPKEGDAHERTKANYPYNKVYATESGHYKEYDDTEGEERIKEHHKSGTHYELQADGSRVTVIQKNDTLTVMGDVTINVTGSVNLKAGQSVTVSAPVIKLNS